MVLYFAVFRKKENLLCVEEKLLSTLLYFQVTLSLTSAFPFKYHEDLPEITVKCVTEILCPVLSIFLGI